MCVSSVILGGLLQQPIGQWQTRALIAIAVEAGYLSPSAAERDDVDGGSREMKVDGKIVVVVVVQRKDFLCELCYCAKLCRPCRLSKV